MWNASNHYRRGSERAASCLDVRYAEQIREAQRFAREHGLGLWSGCIADDQGDTQELSGAMGIVAPQPPAQAPAQNIQAGNCDPSYLDVCIPPAPPDLDCGHISARHF